MNNTSFAHRAKQMHRCASDWYNNCSIQQNRILLRRELQNPMTAPSEQTMPYILRELLQHPDRFSLGQALRLLDLFSREKEANVRPLEHVRIRPWLSLAFPPCDLTEATERTLSEETENDEDADVQLNAACVPEETPVDNEQVWEDRRTSAPSSEHSSERKKTRPKKGTKHLLTTAVLGLYSTLGPLPTLYTEELLEEARHDESVSRDFLDIINNHLAHIHYLAGFHNHLERRTLENKNRDAAFVQFCLMGEAPLSLRDADSPRTLLIHLLCRSIHSASDLERYLRAVLNCTDISVEQCVERRAPIDKRDQICLGRTNTVLGQSTTLGSEIRDSTGKFRIHIYSSQIKNCTF